VLPYVCPALSAASYVVAVQATARALCGSLLTLAAIPTRRRPRTLAGCGSASSPGQPMRCLRRQVHRKESTCARPTGDAKCMYPVSPHHSRTAHLLPSKAWHRMLRCLQTPAQTVCPAPARLSPLPQPPYHRQHGHDHCSNHRLAMPHTIRGKHDQAGSPQIYASPSCLPQAYEASSAAWHSWLARASTIAPWLAAGLLVSSAHPTPSHIPLSSLSPCNLYPLSARAHTRPGMRPTVVCRPGLSWSLPNAFLTCTCSLSS